ncbi:MAG: T9SS type A sorting domain-containing protein, partial [Chitinophagaceae bacterium]
AVWHAAGYNNQTIPVTPSFSPNPCTGGGPYPMGTTQLDISAPIFFTEDIKAPCVAAGVGPSFSGNIGNQQYTVGFFPWQSHTSNYYERNIDVISGTLISPDALEVSTAPVDYTWDAAQSFAISNSSNSGADIWSAWYSGTDVMYKLSTPNVMSFRSTLQTGTIKNPFGQSIYPNPTSKELHVDGAIGSKYRISDVTGRELKSGIVGNSHTIDVQSFATGTYLLWIKDANKKAKTSKFTKN